MPLDHWYLWPGYFAHPLENVRRGPSSVAEPLGLRRFAPWLAARRARLRFGAMNEAARSCRTSTAPSTSRARLTLPDANPPRAKVSVDTARRSAPRCLSRLERKAGRRRRSRCLQPGQQQGRRFPSTGCSSVLRMRRERVIDCLASSIQQINSLRVKGVMPTHATSAAAFAPSACRKSAERSCTTPPGRR